MRSYDAALSILPGVVAAAPAPANGISRVALDFVGAVEIAAVAHAAGRTDVVQRARATTRALVLANPGLSFARAVDLIVSHASGDDAEAPLTSEVVDSISGAGTRLRLLRAMRLLGVDVDAAVAALEQDLGLVPSDGDGSSEGSAWGALTPAEGRVVDLVAEGLSNGEVATRLYLSRYTVESHLKRVFRKLGVRNRAELAAAAARRQG
jgi:DNA-binding CsgD family transcriptional regulator